MAAAPVNLREQLNKLYDLDRLQKNEILKDPFTWYLNVLERYKFFGTVNFPFPEFEPIILYLETYIDGFNIQSSHPLATSYYFIKQKIANTKQVQLCDTFRKQGNGFIKLGCEPWEKQIAEEKQKRDALCAQAKQQRGEPIMVKKSCDTEYELAYNGVVFPYGYTLRLITEIVDFLESWYRYSYNTNPAGVTEFLRSLHEIAELSYCDGKIVDLSKTGYLDLRYRDDYTYYLEFHLENTPLSLVLPTLSKTGSTDLNKLRATPIQIVGVSPVPVFADLSIMSHTNFFWHDVNHGRRNVGLNNFYFKEHAGEYDNNILNFFAEMNAFMKALSRKIQITKADDDLTKNMKRWMKMLIFESVHEDAVVFLPETLILNTLKPAFVCYPFESVNISCFESNRRLVRKFYGPGATTLAIMMTKFRYEFFEKDNALDIIVAPKYRTDLHVSVAVIELIRAIIEICPYIKIKLPLKGLRAYVGELISNKANTERGILKPLQNLPPNICWNTPIQEVPKGAAANYNKKNQPLALNVGATSSAPPYAHPEDEDQCSLKITAEIGEIYNYIKAQNGGTFPEDVYSINEEPAWVGLMKMAKTTEYVPDNYTSFIERTGYEWRQPQNMLPKVNGEFNYGRYLELQTEAGIDDILNLKTSNVKLIQPTMDLTVLNRWRRAHTEAEQAAQKKGVLAVNVSSNALEKLEEEALAGALSAPSVAQEKTVEEVVAKKLNGSHVGAGRRVTRKAKQSKKIL